VARFYEGGKSVLSFKGNSILGQFFRRLKDGPGVIFPRGKSVPGPPSPGGKSNPGPFFRGESLVYATTPGVIFLRRKMTPGL
jgi:hypothetical protein